MADGTISIKVDVDGRDIPVTSSALDKLGDSGQSSAKGLKGAEDGVKGVDDGSERAGLSIKKVATALGLVAIASAAFVVLKDAVGEAITRFDTLERFPKVLESLGVSADDSEAAMSRLSEGIVGLPTHLDDIASTAQRMYSAFGDIDKATDSALALNNALLASGSTAGEAKRGTEMYLKALQRGEMDMVTWRTLSETMNVGLDEVAAGFGFAGKSAKQDLYSALKDGTITMDEFNDKLVEVGTGTGRLADLAKENSKGIGTSFDNLKYAVAMGIADVIKSLDNLSVAVTGSTIAENIDKMRAVIGKAFAAIVTAIEATTPVFKLLATVVSALLPVMSALTPVLVGMATAFAIHSVIRATTTALKESQIVIAALTAVKKLYTLATDGAARAELLSSINAKLLTAARSVMTGITTAATFAELLLTGQITLAAAAKYIAATAAGVLGTAINFMLGPIGWVTLAIGALVGAIIGVVAWFKRSTEEGEKLKVETEQMAERSDELTSSIDSNAQAYQESITSIKSSGEANRELAEDIVELSEIEEKSAADKEFMKAKIEQLNEEVEGLGLSYNEEAEALNLSSEEMEGRIALIEEQASFNAALERQLEISKEQNEVDMEIEAIVALKKSLVEQEKEGIITSSEMKTAQDSLNETEEDLMITKGLLGEEQKIVETQIVESQKAMSEATVGATEEMIQAFDELYEANAETIDALTDKYEEMADLTGDAFDRMSDESKVSAQEMIDNMEHNAEMTAQWGENVAELHEKAGSESSGGFLKWLDEMGPESAAELQVVNEMSDEELSKFIQLMDESGDVASDALKTSLGDGYDETIDIVRMKTDEVNDTARDGLEAGNYSELGRTVPGDTEKGITEGTPSLGDTAEDMGLTANKRVEEMLNPEKFEKIGKDLPFGLSKGITSGKKDVEGASDDMAKGTIMATKDAFQTHSPSVIYKGIGGDLTDGLAGGINDGASKVVSAIDNMFKSVIASSTSSFKALTSGYEAAVNQMEATISKLPGIMSRGMQQVTSSLSSGVRAQTSAMRSLVRMYDRSGQEVGRSLQRIVKITVNAMRAMAQAVKSGSRPVNSAMTHVANNLATPFGTVYSQFSAIGNSAMNGLNSGLSAGSGRVMNRARSIANNVASTMRNALRIHSPSRVMRDDIGKMIPAGMAIGIESNSKLVDNALNNMMSSTPEMALNTGSMAYSGATQPVRSTSPSSGSPTKNNAKDITQPAVINVHVGNKKIATEIVDDITKMQNLKRHSSHKARRK